MYTSGLLIRQAFDRLTKGFDQSTSRAHRPMIVGLSAGSMSKGLSAALQFNPLLHLVLRFVTARTAEDINTPHTTLFPKISAVAHVSKRYCNDL